MTFSPTICRVRCGWHVIDRGWQRHGPSSRNYEDKVAFKEISSIVRKWMYSWCSCSVETEQEYIISKSLFEKYIYSKSVTDRLSTDYSKVVLNFFRLYVEPVLSNMLFYKRKHIRHFDNYSNVKIEATFSSIKNSCTPVTPGTGLHNSVVLLSNMGERNCGKKMKEQTKELISKKTWSTLSCADEVNHRCEQILSKEWSTRSSYRSCRIAFNQWLVTYNPNISNHNEFEYTSSVHSNYIYPRFKRIRKVSVNNNNTFSCSCMMFERFGIPCRHIFHVLSSFPNYKEPRPHDVSVIYWKLYGHYAGRKSNNTITKKLIQQIQTLRENDIAGPSYSESLYLNDTKICSKIPPEFQNYNVIECRNYDIREYMEHKQMLYTPSGYGISMSIIKEKSDIDSEEEKSIYRNVNVEDKVNDDFDKNAMIMEQNLLNNSIPSKKNAYGELNPIFKELVSHLQNKSQTDINRVKTLLISELNKIQNTYNASDITKVSHKGTFVSSHANYVKKRKTHGTDYYRK